MKRINLYALHHLGVTLGALANNLESLRTKDSVRRSDLGGTVYRAKYALETFSKEKYEPPCPMSQQEAKGLLQWLNNLTLEKEDDKDPVIEGFYMWLIGDKLERFDHILSAEIPHAETYLIPDKRAYKIPALLTGAENALAESTIQALPLGVVSDLREAGRCVALEIPTAAGFHIFRAVEAVVVSYFPALGIPAPKIRNLGRYIRKLKESNANPKIMGMLDHLKDHHRNPIIHPETSLTADEALDLFGFAMSAINAMVRDIEAEKQKRAAPELTGFAEVETSALARAAANILLGPKGTGTEG